MSETIKEKVYSRTKEQCKASINGVCSGCGGELVPIETEDNSGNPTYWPGCEECSAFDYGVDKSVFEIAQEMVVKHGHIPYSHIENPHGKDDSYKKHWLSSQIRGTVNLVRTVLAIQARQKSSLEK